MSIRNTLGRIPRSDLAIILIAVLYILSPIDFVPELVTGPLGLTDDVAAAGVLGVTLLRVRSMLRNESETVIVQDPPAETDGPTGQPS